MPTRCHTWFIHNKAVKQTNPYSVEFTFCGTGEKAHNQTALLYTTLSDSQYEENYAKKRNSGVPGVSGLQLKLRFRKATLKAPKNKRNKL